MADETATEQQSIWTEKVTVPFWLIPMVALFSSMAGVLAYVAVT